MPATEEAVAKPPPNPLLSLKRGPNPKRNAEELEIKSETAKRYSSWTKVEKKDIVVIYFFRVKERIAEDQKAILNPDVDAPFTDELDVTNRLLPYHIFQQPRDDLEQLISGKGKEKAVNQEWENEVTGVLLNNLND